MGGLHYLKTHELSRETTSGARMYWVSMINVHGSVYVSLSKILSRKLLQSSKSKQIELQEEEWGSELVPPLSTSMISQCSLYRDAPYSIKKKSRK